MTTRAVTVPRWGFLSSRRLRPRAGIVLAAAVVAAAMAGTVTSASGTPIQAPGTIDTVAGGLGQGRPTNVGNDPKTGLVFVGGHLYVGDATIGMVRDVDLANNFESVVPTTSGLGHNVIDSIRDGAGNFYVFLGGSVFSYPRFQCQVVKIAPGGATTVVAGTGTCGFSGDGGAATAAQLAQDGETRLALDPAGNLYISDSGNNRVRKVNAWGVITTVAGTGARAHGGDGGPATKATLAGPGAMVFDPAGNLYLADVGNGLVRRIAARTGVISTVAGRAGGICIGSSFDGDGIATQHNLGCPRGLALDKANRLFISDYRNARVRRVDLAAKRPMMVTVAGNGTTDAGAPGGIGDGGPGTSASIGAPSHLALDGAGNLYIADDYYHRVRKLTTAGVITTAVGNGHVNYGGDGSPGPWGQLEADYLPGLASDGAGNLFFTDPRNFAVRRLSSDGILSTVAGTGDGVGDSGLSPDGGAATATAVDGLRAVAADASGVYFTTNAYDCRVRHVDATGAISTVAGSQGAPFAPSCGNSGDGGPAASALVDNPAALALDGAHHLYVGTGCSVRMIDLAATPPTISTVAGNGACGNSGDGGSALSAQIDPVGSLAVDGAGKNLYLAAVGPVVRKVDLTSGTISTVAGSPTYGDPSTFSPPFGDGGPATSAYIFVDGLAVDAAGANLYITDTAHNRVRRVDLATGTLSTVAGNDTRVYVGGDNSGVPRFSGDGGPATSAELDMPQGLAVDTAGGLYIADTHNRRIRKVMLGS